MNSSARVALLDACVLYPPPLRDFLMWLAVGGVCHLRLTDAIHDEWIRNALRDYPDLTAEKLDRTRTLMNGVAPQTLVTNYEHLTDTLVLPDPNDRHVLAAAIYAKVEVIVTFNLKDFPADALSPHGITAVHPDEFVTGLLQNANWRQEIIALSRRGRANLKNPPKTVEEYLDGLRRNRLTRVAEFLEHYTDEL